MPLRLGGQEGGLEGDEEPRESVSWLPGAARRPVDGQGGEEEEGTQDVGFRCERQRHSPGYPRPRGQVFALRPRAGGKSSVHGRDVSSFSSVFLRPPRGAKRRVWQGDSRAVALVGEEDVARAGCVDVGRRRRGSCRSGGAGVC